MGQEEVYKTLLNADKPLSAQEIAQRMNVELNNSLFCAIRKLVEQKEILFINLEPALSKEIYNCTKAIRLFFTESLIIKKEFLENVLNAGNK